MSKELDALEAIRKEFQSRIDFPINLTPEYGIIKQALKRNEPMEPVMSDSGYHVCKCTKRLHINDNYCSHCGQKLDWSDEKDV